MISSDFYKAHANCLFLDRDGVINRRVVGAYISQVESFEFLPGVLHALPILASKFEHIVVVTNQQGIGKGILTEPQLQLVHTFMLEQINNHGGRIDAVFYAGELQSAHPINRKPGIGMAIQAQQLFPKINFAQSIMVGDSASDISFGHYIGAATVLIKGKEPEPQPHAPHFEYASLQHFAQAIARF